jgi:hypothetical protein
VLDPARLAPRVLLTSLDIERCSKHKHTCVT